MIKEIILPKVSENVEEGDVVKVLVNVGDMVDVDQSIIELETDKALFEVPSSAKGKVTEVNVKEGDVIKVGQVIIKMETDGEIKEEFKEEKKEETKEKVETQRHKDTEKKEERKEDEKEEKEEKKEGFKEEKKEEEKKLEVRAQKAEVKEEKIEPQRRPAVRGIDSDAEEKREHVPAAPAVRRLARELGVYINEVKGSGPGGRIVEEDVKGFAKEKLEGRNQRSEVKAEGRERSEVRSKKSEGFNPLPVFSKWGEVKREPMSKVRLITAESMYYAWTTVPQVTQFDEADITDLEKFRKNYNEKVKDEKGNLTMTSILVKVISSALKEFLQFNASVNMNKREIVYKKYVNIGIAVDTDRGLLVPVIKNADKKNLNDLPYELTELSEKARNKKISPDEMEGGNFTISNLGGIGGTNFSPIVYTPQVAILGVSRAKTQAVYTEGKFEPRLMLPLSLSYDHKLIDGADAARFLRWVCEALENPLLLIL